jgi:hypothetical protein
LSTGSITAGLARHTLIDKTIAFTRDQLAAWRDDPTRPQEQSENRLNGQLCKHLNAAAREAFPMVQFNHEEPQAPRRAVDISATPAVPLTVGSQDYSIYEPFLVMEGKRLPMPSKAREREYLTGLAKRSGGVQRFKLGLHGATLTTAVMLGYLQDGSAAHWRRTINCWVKQLAAAADTRDDSWYEHEQLRAARGKRRDPVAVSHSRHPRTGSSASPIALVHLWVEM